MPRKPRKQSKTDIYHCVFRGTNKQTLFDSRYDYQRYLEIMHKVKTKIGFELHAYCLMSNHVHLLVKIPYDQLPKLSQCINTSYAHFYNHKYCRTGHLFEVRFGSIPVETPSHYMNSVRYIHQNPVHAGIINNAEAHKYSWSSLKEFKSFGGQNTSPTHPYLCDTALVAAIFDEHATSHHDTFFAFHTIVSKSGAFEHDDHRLTDQEAQELISQTFGDRIEYIKNLDKLDRTDRNQILIEIKNLKISVNQISRITGLGKNIIQRA